MMRTVDGNNGIHKQCGVRYLALMTEHSLRAVIPKSIYATHDGMITTCRD